MNDLGLPTQSTLTGVVCDLSGVMAELENCTPVGKKGQDSNSHNLAITLHPQEGFTYSLMHCASWERASRQIALRSPPRKNEKMMRYERGVWRRRKRMDSSRHDDDDEEGEWQMKRWETNRRGEGRFIMNKFRPSFPPH